MQTITIGEKITSFDIGSPLRVKDMAKIQPIIINKSEG
jgi:hypothetical protein